MILQQNRPYAKLFTMQYGKPHSVWLSLGTNMAQREEHLRNAVKALDEHDGIRIRKESDWFDTDPMGVVDQPAFLNMTVEIETELNPLELLNAVKSIERMLGRETGTRWGPRLIDIDIVLYEDRILESPELAIPHKQFRKRAFVLEPLAQIAGDKVDPVTQATVAELATRPEAVGKVRRIAPSQHIGTE